MLTRILLLVFLIIVIYIAYAFANPIPKRNVDPAFEPMYGFSFSFEQARWYGLNPRESFIQLLEEVDFKWIRLPFFWDQMTTDGEFNNNFDDLRFAIEEAQKRNIDVIVALGAKTPYYPEYHWPKEIEKQVKFGRRITIDHPVAKDILYIDRRVVKELSVYDNIIYWQVENEPLIGNVNKWKIDFALIKAEVEVVRSTDSKKRPIILNHAATGFYDRSWQKLLPILRAGDVFAVNAFFKTKGIDLITASILGQEIHFPWPDYLVWPVQSWFLLSPNFESIKNQVEKNGAKFWIMEMQSEPYINNLKAANNSSFFLNPKDIITEDHFLKSYKVESIGFWGVHFWQFREKHGDSTWIDTAKSIINNSKN
ncbi:hypothetical protein A3A48_00805 [Candidatus Curtissbacteria bacterium RIFCSPLOWO2_01_FULL_37_9]|uniref:Glycoside hydrolase family 5 domain-containing protein n=1 Tax=Candidatus Curtissbacteria bacterium RIFCSPLOWO2_01_FULL_37_9 TaxID=1797724 RepID=A0A1F5GUN1_9BACT|nr:MAG: hypothetical protein A3A48_00805 [Candidatus Curtissbacteria bacterium RIFCSPLOWO2_01_FULL_37_9]